VETSLAQSMIIFDQQWTGFFTRPIALAFFALAMISLTGAQIRVALARIFHRDSE
jgi:TctA family transporter